MSTTARQLRNVIAASLAAGERPSDIAKREEVTEGYISQLRTDPDFQLLLAKYSNDTTTQQAYRDALIDSLQDRALEKLSLNFDKCTRTSNEILRVFKVTNEARRSGYLNTPESSKVVQVTLPIFLVKAADSVSYQTNEQNEVVEIDGRPLISQTSEDLLNSVANRRSRKEKEINSAPIRDQFVTNEISTIEDELSLDPNDF